MNLPLAVAEKAAILAETDDSLLPLFPPMERAVIISLKEMMKNKKESPIAVGHSEHNRATGEPNGIRFTKA